MESDLSCLGSGQRGIITAVSYEIMGTVIALRSADARRIGIKIIQ